MTSQIGHVVGARHVEIEAAVARLSRRIRYPGESIDHCKTAGRVRSRSVPQLSPYFGTSADQLSAVHTHGITLELLGLIGLAVDSA